MFLKVEFSNSFLDDEIIKKYKIIDYFALFDCTIMSPL